MQADFDSVLLDIDGSNALEQAYDRKTEKLKLIDLTAASAVMQAMNAKDAPEGEKMDRYEIIKKIRACPGAVELTEKEPEMIRAAVQKMWPAFIYGQVCEALNLK